jgi:hypothetical protein
MGRHSQPAGPQVFTTEDYCNPLRWSGSVCNNSGSGPFAKSWKSLPRPRGSDPSSPRGTKSTSGFSSLIALPLLEDAGSSLLLRKRYQRAEQQGSTQSVRGGACADASQSRVDRGEPQSSQVGKTPVAGTPPTQEGTDASRRTRDATCLPECKCRFDRG